MRGHSNQPASSITNDPSSSADGPLAQKRLDLNPSTRDLYLIATGRGPANEELLDVPQTIRRRGGRRETTDHGLPRVRCFPTTLGRRVGGFAAEPGLGKRQTEEEKDGDNDFLVLRLADAG